MFPIQQGTKWPEDRHYTAVCPELSKVNWNWTMKQANEWIEWYAYNIPRRINAGRREPYLSAVQSKRRTIASGLPSPASDMLKKDFASISSLSASLATTLLPRGHRVHISGRDNPGALLCC